VHGLSRFERRRGLQWAAMSCAFQCRNVGGRVVAAGWCTALIGALGCAAVDSLALAREPWRDMDYGPCLAATYEAAPGNLAYKGLAVRIDPGPGGVASGK
jgi:hypothetical protein